MTTTERPAFRIARGDSIRHARRTWRVQAIELVAVFARKPGASTPDPRLRFRLSDGSGHHVNLTVDQYDVVRVVVQ